MAAERAPVTPVEGPARRPVPERALAFEERPLVWGSILGGFLIGLTLFAFLALLGVALGLTVFNTGLAAAQGTVPAAQTGINSTIWAGVSSIIGYLIGGYAAARIADLSPRGRAAGNGVMVFLLSVPFALFMASQGMSGVLGGLGGLAGGMAEVIGMQVPGQPGVTISPADAARAMEAARNAAWGALLGSLLALGASALGGYLGGRDVGPETAEAAPR